MLIYFAKGTLPWANLFGKTKAEQQENIKKTKVDTPVEELCSGLPPEFKEYIIYCRGLKFEQDPDYQYCIDLFAQCMKNAK